MAKPHKKAAEPEAPIMPLVGDKVTIPRISSVLEVEHVGHDGTEVTLRRPGTNLQWFRVKADTLTYVDPKAPARTSNPFTNPEHTFDADEILQRIRTVQSENLQRLDGDIEILTKYLRSEDAPKAAISTLEGMRAKQHESWKAAVERIEKIFEE